MFNIYIIGHNHAEITDTVATQASSCDIDVGNRPFHVFPRARVMSKISN